MTEVTFYQWRKQYAGLDFGELRDFRALRDENTQLRRVVADLVLFKTLFKDALGEMLRSRQRGDAVAVAHQTIGVTERRACRVLAVERAVIRYGSHSRPDGALRTRLRELDMGRISICSLWLDTLPLREGIAVKCNRVHRLHLEEGPQLKLRRQRRRKAHTVRCPPFVVTS